MMSSVPATGCVGLVIASALTFASCGRAVQFLATVRDLRAVQQHVSAETGITDVSVNLQIGRLNIGIASSELSGTSPTERQDRMQRIARAAYLAYPHRSQVQTVTVALLTRRTHYGSFTDAITSSQAFRPIELIERSGLSEHWVRPPPSLNSLYLVAIGDVPPDLISQLTLHFHRTLGIAVEELPAIPSDPLTFDAVRSQVVAEELLSAIRRVYPAVTQDSSTRVIGITGDDMYLRSMAKSWAFGFSLRSDDERMAVVSYAQMDPTAFGLASDTDMLRSRVTKMVAKNIGVLYFGLPLSDDPRSVLYRNIGGTDELDVMTEYFDPR